MSQVKAPWGHKLVEMLNTSQKNSDFHPYTCGGPRSDDTHKEYAKDNGDIDLGVLVASKEGWKCPVCDYTQDWCHVWDDDEKGTDT